MLYIDFLVNKNNIYIGEVKMLTKYDWQTMFEEVKAGTLSFDDFLFTINEEIKEAKDSVYDATSPSFYLE